MYTSHLDDPIRLSDRKGLHPNWAEDEEEKGFKLAKRPLKGLDSIALPGLSTTTYLWGSSSLPRGEQMNTKKIRETIARMEQLDDKNNTSVYHEQGFYLDGSGDNIGISREETLTQEDIREYKLEDKEYSGKRMRRVQAGLSDQDYSLLGWFGKKKNNCQDFADTLRGRYSQLKRGDRQR